MICLAVSNSFVAQKELGVLGPLFAHVYETSDQGAGLGVLEAKVILPGFVIHGYLGGRSLFTKAAVSYFPFPWDGPRLCIYPLRIRW